MVRLFGLISKSTGKINKKQSKKYTYFTNNTKRKKATIINKKVGKKLKYKLKVKNKKIRKTPKSSRRSKSEPKIDIEANSLLWESEILDN